MCTISGFFVKTPLNENFVIVDRILRKMILGATERGRESSGISIFECDKVITSKVIGHPRGLEFWLTSNSKMAINNNRAEPTTEFVKEKTLNDVQPFNYKNVYCVHNGTITSDKDILKNESILPTKIDSYAIPYAIYNNKFHELLGSMSIAFFVNNKSLFLYKN